MKIIKARKPKNYNFTNLFFLNLNSAQKYTEFLNQDFLTKKAKSLEMNLSKRKRKNLMFSKPKRYILTSKGNKYLLWESY